MNACALSTVAVCYCFVIYFYNIVINEELLALESFFAREHV